MDLLNSVGHALGYISISILLSGTGVLFTRPHSRVLAWARFYLLALLLFETSCMVVVLCFDRANLAILSYSSLLHFGLLTYFFFWLKPLAPPARRWVTGLLTGILLLSVVANFATLSATDFHSYDRVLGGMIAIGYALLGFRRLTQPHYPYQRAEMLLYSSVLLFFALDAFLAIATSYLVSQSLWLVGWFWNIRGLSLQLFYLSIIYYAWQSGKTR